MQRWGRDSGWLLALLAVACGGAASDAALGESSMDARATRSEAPQEPIEPDAKQPPAPAAAPDYGRGELEPAPPVEPVEPMEPHAAAGQGSSGEQSMPAVPLASCDGFALLQTSCAASVCHGGPDTFLSNFAGSLELARSFVDRPSPLCTNENVTTPIFDPDDPAGSLVIQKMRGTSICGGRMPLGALTTNEDDVRCIESWIATL
jgi:hypothetical protein